MSNYPLDGIGNEGKKVTDCLSKNVEDYKGRSYALKP